MTVTLLPPVTGSLCSPIQDWPRDVALTEAPNFMRSHASTRWHRVRAGVSMQRPWGLTVVYRYWCGQATFADRSLGVETLPDQELLCGTCEGRAIGAGQISRPGLDGLVFSPMWIDPPAICPGSKNLQLVARLDNEWREGRCLVCGHVDKLRYAGGPYNGRTNILRHPPGDDLVAPCEFHAWRMLVAARFPNGDVAVVCRCMIEVDR